MATNVNRHEILDGKVAVPASARALLDEIGGYAQEAKARIAAPGEEIEGCPCLAMGAANLRTT